MKSNRNFQRLSFIIGILLMVYASVFYFLAETVDDKRYYFLFFMINGVLVYLDLTRMSEDSKNNNNSSDL